jgi:hypothetical protein
MPLTAMKMKKTNILNDKETFLSAKSVIVIFGTDNNLKAMEYLNFVLENIKLNFVFIVCKCTYIMVVEQ